MQKLIVTIFFFVIQFNFLHSQNGFQVYYGNLHSHTGDSDGEGSPADAFLYARDSAGLDFLAVTDHVEQVDIFEWWALTSAANSATINGVFVALAGYEWGSPLYGHCCQYNTSELLLEIGWFYTDWDGFRQWVMDHSSSFAQFNHPADEVYFTNWDDFEYQDAQSDSVFPLIEFQNIQQATDWYEYALIKGWHVSPVWNQDNHSADWGNKNTGRAGVWAASLTKSELYDAIRKRRTFATTDKNAAIWLDVCGVSMGRNVQRTSNSPIHIVLSDPNPEQWINIELVTQQGVVQSFISSSSHTDTTIFYTPSADNWMFIRATQNDSDMLWSAPVFFTGTLTMEKEISMPGLIDFHLSENNGELIIATNGNYPSSSQCPMAELYTLSGQLIARNFIDGFPASIPISGLPKGMYLVRITDTRFLMNEKFLKQ